MIKVRVVEQGGVFKDGVEVAEDSTVQEAIAKAGVNTSRTKEIRVNTEKAELSDIVHDGDLIHIIPNIEGAV